MSFFTRKWVVIVIGLLGMIGLGVEVWATITFPILAPKPLGFEAILLTFAMAGGIAMFGVWLVLWLEKYWLYFKLWRLLGLRTPAFIEREIITWDGKQYAVSGDPSSYTMVETTPGGNRMLTFWISKGYISVRASAADESASADEKGTARFIFDANPRAVLRRLNDALEAPAYAAANRP